MTGFIFAFMLVASLIGVGVHNNIQQLKNKNTNLQHKIKVLQAKKSKKIKPVFSYLSNVKVKNLDEDSKHAKK